MREQALRRDARLSRLEARVQFTDRAPMAHSVTTCAVPIWPRREGAARRPGAVGALQRADAHAVPGRDQPSG